jgi:Ca-activated chloride channel family protein
VKQRATCATVAVVLTAVSVLPQAAQRPPDPPQGGVQFRSSVDLVNVTVTVTDASGRFVPGLTQEDFEVFEDGQPQQVAFFSAERVPVSLGIAIDTSGSMAGEKMTAARDALDRFLFDLLGTEDEVFLYRITDRPDRMEKWTKDRRRISRALRRITPDGGTALYDTVAEAVPLAQSGEHRKKALVIISDGNDTSSNSTPADVRRKVQGTEVLVYAVGIDGRNDTGIATQPPWPRRPPIIPPFPIPGGGRPPWYPPGTPPGFPGPQPGGRQATRGNEPLNVAALRALTDDSGGRTEVVRSAVDLDPATASIANELSRQYFLGYASGAPRDGKWHDIVVRVKNADYRVRHRRGYLSRP